MARGKTRQQARGHKAHEHVERRERERAEYGLSNSEVSSIRRWATRRSEEITDSRFDPEEVIEVAREKGWQWFVTYRDTWNAARKTYRREQRAGTYASRGMGYLEFLGSTSDVDDISWVYYH